MWLLYFRKNVCEILIRLWAYFGLIVKAILIILHHIPISLVSMCNLSHWYLTQNVLYINVIFQHIFSHNLLIQTCSFRITVKQLKFCDYFIFANCWKPTFLRVLFTITIQKCLCINLIWLYYTVHCRNLISNNLI